MAFEVPAFTQEPWTPGPDEPEKPKKFILTKKGISALGVSLTFLAYFINGITDW